MFQAVMESTGDPDTDMPPTPPAGVHSVATEMTSYSKMMAALVDQVKIKVDGDKPENRFEAYVADVKEHQAKVVDLQRQLEEQLESLTLEESKKITSEGIHIGFDSSSVSKPDPKPVSAPKKSTKSSDKVQAVEVLNPQALASSKNEDATQSSGADADVDEPVVNDDAMDRIEASEIGLKFASIRIGDYRLCQKYINEHPSVVAEKETDGLLVLAFNSLIAGRDDYATQCVHQGLLLQYCRALGHDGVNMFFNRIMTQGHKAQKVFFDDVKETFKRIKARAQEAKIEMAQEEEEESGGVEQIQLHAVDPGTEIKISIPPTHSEDPDTIKAREVFNTFPPGLQRALESQSLDEINKVLAKMSVEEAEEIVGQLGEVSSEPKMTNRCHEYY